MSEFYWWGYRHVNGSINVKRYFNRADIDEAYNSDFVMSVAEPFLADGRQDALNQASKMLKSD